MQESRRLLFVYGSLKRGLSRHHFLAEQTFFGDATTLPDYALYDFGDYPAMTAGTQAVHGELYEVSAACWPILDRVECVSDALYRCELVALRPPFDESTVWAYLYAQPISQRACIGSVWPP